MKIAEEVDTDRGFRLLKRLLVGSAFIAFSLLSYKQAMAHCDGMDGPVVKAAQEALNTGNVNLVLIWVQKKDEPEITKAFQKTLAMRKISPEVGNLADRYFFETLVRIHRSGEGAPFTGLKPAGRDLGPAIPAADAAIKDGGVEPLMKLLSEEMRNGLHKRFGQLVSKKKFDRNDVKAGREYVKAYVEFVHYVERLHEASRGPAHGHFQELETDQGGESHASDSR